MTQPCPLKLSADVDPASRTTEPQYSDRAIPPWGSLYRGCGVAGSIWARAGSHQSHHYQNAHGARRSCRLHPGQHPLARLGQLPVRRRTLRGGTSRSTGNRRSILYREHGEYVNVFRSIRTLRLRQRTAGRIRTASVVRSGIPPRVPLLSQARVRSRLRSPPRSCSPALATVRAQGQPC